MNEFNVLFNELNNYIIKIEDKFISSYIPSKPEDTPEQYEDDVKAYCILSHALFEDYFEQISTKVMEKCISEWYYKKVITAPLLTLLSYSKTRIDTDKNDLPSTVFDMLRKLIDEAKKQYSLEIHNNNGTSEKYLQKLFFPISIDIIQDATIMNSLNKLCSARGSYAHKKVKGAISPEDAKNYVEDCLKLCEHVKMQAIFKFYEEACRKDFYKKLHDILINREEACRMDL